MPSFSPASSGFRGLLISISSSSLSGKEWTTKQSFQIQLTPPRNKRTPTRLHWETPREISSFQTWVRIWCCHPMSTGARVWETSHNLQDSSPTVRNYVSRNVNKTRVKQFTKKVKGSKPHPESVTIQVTLNKLFCLSKTSPGSDLYGPGGGVA